MIAAWLWAVGCAEPASSEVQIALVDGSVRATLPAGSELLEVRVADARTDQPLLGSYARDGDTTVFTPRFQLVPGTRWEVIWAPPSGEPQVMILETPPAPEAAPTHLLRLEPESPKVPANLLKLTLTFSAPMRGGLTLTDHILLIDEQTGEADEHAWYRNELWGTERKRLTLLLHPGRTKTGISFNRDFGPVLQEGRRYRVHVTTGLLDLAGRPLAEPFDWEFQAAPPDHERPVPEDWVLSTPDGPEGSLFLAFDEPMDGWLLETAFVVEDDARTAVAGTLVPSPDATGVAFTPLQPWDPGAYTLRQVGQVEDRAGNTPDRIFDGPADIVKRQGPIQDTWHFNVP